MRLHIPAYQRFLFSVWLFTAFAIYSGKGQDYTINQCIEVLDSLYNEPEIGDVEILKQRSIHYLNHHPSDSLKAKLSEYWAYVHENQYEYDSALKYYENAEDYFLQIGDSLMSAYMVYGQATSLTELQEHVLSTEKYLLNLEYYESIGSEGDFADTHNAMANNYYYAGDEHIAISYYRKAVAYYEIIGDGEQIASIYGNMASAFNLMGLTDSSLFYYQKALKEVIDTDLTDVIIGLYHGIGNAKESMESYDDAYYYYRRALDLSMSVKRDDLLGFSYQYLGYYYLLKENYDSAIFYGEMADQIATKKGIYLLKYNSYDLMSQVYDQMGEHEKAYDYLKLLKSQDDSLFTIKKSRQINIMMKNYESEKNQREMLAKDLELARYRSSLQEEQSLRTIMIVALVAMFAMVILMLRNERVKTKANRLLQKKNQEIIAKNHQIQRIEEVKSKWFINISHELRTPLSLIKGPLQQISRVEKLQGQSESLINIANRNIANLEELINEILDLSRLEAGKIKLEYDIFDIVASLEVWLEPFQDVVNERNISLQTKLHLQDAQLFVKLDRNQIRKVVSNLLSNAIKYTEDNGEIVVEIKADDEDLELIVSDTGVGIPKNEQPYVFDRFFQASNFSQNQEQGSGVGLSMCKEIVELHKGIIEFESDLGLGTRFVVKLPDVVLIPDSERDKEQEGSENTKYLAPSVLLVEDNVDMQDFVHSFLDKRYEVVRKLNAHEAMDAVIKDEPDLIITDLMMPKMDGFHFIQKLKENPQYRTIPIIVITAIADEEKRLSLLRQGIDDYLIKPFNPEELVIKVENLLSNQTQRKSAVRPEEEEEELSYEDRLVKELEQKVREHISDPDFNVTKLADEASLSERQLYRYLRQTTKMTPANFIKEIRLQRAFELARRNVYATTSELSYAVGFQHPSYFTTVFKKRFGKKPSDYMKERSS
jgi:signal transduction histidine kinase/DNA-binding response OmpR family regulator